MVPFDRMIMMFNNEANVRTSHGSVSSLSRTLSLYLSSKVVFVFCVHKDFHDSMLPVEAHELGKEIHFVVHHCTSAYRKEEHDLQLA